MADLKITVIDDGSNPRLAQIMQRVASEVENEVKALLTMWSKGDAKSRHNCVDAIARLSPSQAALYAIHVWESIKEAQGIEEAHLFLTRLLLKGCLEDQGHAFRIERSEGPSPP
jgi:1,2-phenylacetyl-CoA epoxidase catalytic subunit